MNAEQDLLNFPKPPVPIGLVLSGSMVRIEPLDPNRHAIGLFEANQMDTSGSNWDYLPYGPFGSFDEYLAWLNTVCDKEDPVFFAILSLADEKPVGIASLMAIDVANGSIEVGHINFSPLLQRTTAATEAMYLMMSWAFESGYRRYQWRCNSLNLPSRKAAQRLGLSYEGTFRQVSIVKGRNRDTAWFAAIDQEWPALKTKFEKFLAVANFDDQGKPILSLSELTRPLLFAQDPAMGPRYKSV